MTAHFPMHISFRILGASMSSELEVRDGQTLAYSSLKLILLADSDTKIQLSSGEPLSDIEVNLTVSSRWHTPTELDKDLTSYDVGFLCHTRESNGKAFVHGALLWPDEPLPQYLLSENMNRRAQLVISSLPTLFDPSPAHSWGESRKHFLHVSSANFSSAQIES